MDSNSRIVNFDGLKQAIKEKVDPVDLLERRMEVEFVSHGKACCPLPEHDDTHPSFEITDEGIWHCFSCKGGGDLYDLIGQTQHLDFIGSIRWLAEDLDVDVEDFSRPMTDQERAAARDGSSLERWLRDLEITTPFDKDGKPRISRETAETYGVVKPEKYDRNDPAFMKERPYLSRGDFLLPYRDHRGVLTGFKVRVTDPDGKRLMFKTPNDSLIDKPVLWGLDVARDHVKDSLVLVEGEIDAMALHDKGIRNVAALGGSSIADAQIQIIKDLRIAKLVLFMDGDDTGRAAAEKIALEYWNDPDIQLYVVSSWEGADPEEIVRAVGPEPVRGLINEAQAALVWLIRAEYARRGECQTITDKIDFIGWIGDMFGGRIGNARHRLVLNEVAGWMGLSESDFFDITRANLTVLQSPESERVVLSRAMVDRNYYMGMRKLLSADDFYVIAHQRLFSVLADMLVDGLDFDVLTAKRRAEEKGVKPEIVDEIAAIGHNNTGYHETKILDMSVRRASRQDVDRFRSEIGDLNVPIEDTIGLLTHAVTDKVLARTSRAAGGIGDQVDETIEKIHAMAADPDKIRGIDFGKDQFPKLVRGFSGFQSRRMYTVAGTSGKGKSTLGIQWMTALSLNHAVPGDIVSLEMDPDEILIKIASLMTGIDSTDITNGTLEKEQLHRIERSLMRVRSSPLKIYAPDGLTASELLLYARESVMDRRTEIFMIDFIQQMNPEAHQTGSSKYDYIGAAAYMVKQKICRGLDTSAILVAQLKRDAGTDPTAEDIGDSYDITRASDAMILIGESESGGTEIGVGKNRGGAGGNMKIPVTYDMPVQTFYEAGADKEPSYGLFA